MDSLTRIALCQGNDRVENLRRSIAMVINNLNWPNYRQVLIKPNLVEPECALAITHIDALAVLLEEIRTRYDGSIRIGEGCALMPTPDAYQLLGFNHLANFYNAHLVDLNADEWLSVQIYRRNGRLLNVRLAQTVIQSDCRISLTLPKTHDVVRVTLTIKNMIMGSLINRRLIQGKDHPDWRDRAGQILIGHGNGLGSDKVAMHQGYPMMNINLAHLALLVRPHLSLVDGFVAMEGEGPINGTPVPWRVAIAGTDPLAVDVFTARHMGFELDEIGYLKYCAEMGLGCIDPNQTHIIGDTPPEAITRRFKRHPLDPEQRRWYHPQSTNLLNELIRLENMTR